MEGSGESPISGLPVEIAYQILGELSYKQVALLGTIHRPLRDYVHACVRKISIEEIPDIATEGAIPEYFLHSFPGIQVVKGPIEVGEGQSIPEFSRRIRGDLHFRVKRLLPEFFQVLLVRANLFPNSEIEISTSVQRIRWAPGRLTLDTNIYENYWKKYLTLPPNVQTLELDIGHPSDAVLGALRGILGSGRIREIVLDILSPTYLPPLIPYGTTFHTISFRNLSLVRDGQMGNSLLVRSGLSPDGKVYPEVMEVVRRNLHRLEGVIFRIDDIPKIVREFPLVREISVYVGEYRGPSVDSLVLSFRPYIEDPSSPNPILQRLRQEYPGYIFHPYR